jgi:Bax protein
MILARSRQCLCSMILLAGLMTTVFAQEVIVLNGTKDTISWLKAKNFWGEEKRGEQLQVPRAIITGISPGWQKNSAKLPVSQKKEIFYRLMLPLVVNANTMVLEHRADLGGMDAKLANGKNLSTDELREITKAAEIMKVAKAEQVASKSKAELRAMIADILYKLDVIPAGLVLGQAAYESGYGTSRFAAKGNALFGQWTYGGTGMVPGEQRKQLGDHRVAAYDWPFDSVRAYYINLNSHTAYAGFRKLRAEAHAAGKPLSSIELAEGLVNYSERGQEYVDTLRSMIRVNKLDIADGAVFRDEPLSFLVGADSEQSAVTVRGEILELRSTGQLGQVIQRMHLEAM